MATYTFNDYCNLTFSNPNAPRLVIYPNKDVAASLLNHHKSSGAVVVPVADCVTAEVATLPMPDTLLPCLDEKILSQNGRVVVVGIDAYLSLLAADKVAAFFVGLRGRIDDGRLNAVYLVSEKHNPHFNNPKYEESLDVVSVSGDFEQAELPQMSVVSDEWVKPGTLTDYHSLLRSLGNFLPTGDHTLVLKNICSEQAGLGTNVSFFLDIQRIAEHFYGISANLNSNTLKLLISKVKERGGTPESYLEAEFVKSNINVRIAVKRLLELPADDIWGAYVWLLQKQLPADSYLAKVLSSEVTQDNLLRKCTVDSAITVLNDNQAKRFAAERAEALAGLSVESLIVEFIERTKDVHSAIEFLNCNTDAERIEIVRRASTLDLSAGLPESFQRLYPALADYLSSEFDYDTTELNTYFKEYRKLKITNTITEAFVEKAFGISLSAMIPHRDLLLSDLRADDTALLVVDGMGAEYLPLLMKLAKRRSMNMESVAVASAKMPTSTQFNSIKWDAEQTLDAVKSLDNIAHNGASQHERCPAERNIAAALRVLEKEVFNRIAEGLSRFSRVVVTADHGSSRLAVIAHNKGLGKTLQWDGQPLDWRYSPAIENGTCPPELESQYHPDSGQTYWVVRGYNRLPKSGGKVNELHGGASLEERLVPIVVFTGAICVDEPKEIGKKIKEQIVDKMGFDI